MTMKRIALLIVAILCLAAGAPICSVVNAAQREVSDNGKSAIKFKKKTHDFGTIKEADGPVTCKFEFTNTGTAPLVIISATAGCGCTKPTFEEEPIQPGKSSEIRVTFNPSGRPGEFNKNVTVKTNAPSNKKIVLKISGSVIPEK